MQQHPQHCIAVTERMAAGPIGFETRDHTNSESVWYLCCGMTHGGYCVACRREKERLVTLSKCFKHLNAVVSPMLAGSCAGLQPPAAGPYDFVYQWVGGIAAHTEPDLTAGQVVNSGSRP